MYFPNQYLKVNNTDRQRCTTLHSKENSMDCRTPPLNEQLLIQNQKLQETCNRLQNECNRLDYHLKLNQQNFNQLKMLYDQDQCQIQKLNNYAHQLQLQLEDQNTFQTRILDLEQDNYHLHQQVEHFRNTLQQQEDLENQRQQLSNQQEKLLQLSRELNEEVKQICSDPLMELLEVWRDRALKSCTYVGSQQNTTKEKYRKLSRLTRQAAELMSFKLNYK